MRFRHLPALAFLALALTGCATSTLLSHWRDESFDGAAYKKIFIIGMSPVPENRRSFETEFARQLDARIGADGVPSSDVIPDFTKLDSLAVVEAVRSGGFDAVLVTRLVRIDKELKYSSGESRVVPETYYNDLYDYHYTVYREVRAPGKVGESDVVVLETNLYETGAGDLVWTGKTESYSPENIPQLVDDLATLVLTKMHGHGLITGKS